MDAVERNEYLSEAPADRVFMLEFSGTVVTEDVTKSEALPQSEAQTTHWIEEDRL